MSETKRLSQKEQRIREERIEMAQALLNRPWIRKEEDAELFFKMREHYEVLRNWFQEMCGFTLIQTRDLFKLEKIPGKPQPWMGFTEFKTGLDYVFFIYALLYLEDKSELEQFLLKDLLDDIQNKLKMEGVDFDHKDYQKRLSLKRALKKLRQLGVLIVVDGDEEEWLHHYEDLRKTVLYECTPLIRFVVRRFSQDITAFETMSQFGEGVYSPTKEGDVARRRHHVFRRLIQEPLVLDREWSDDERHYVLIQRAYLLDQIERMLGLQGKRYKEGLLFYHSTPKGEMELFPTEKSITDLVLLLAVEIRRHQEDHVQPMFHQQDNDLVVTRSDLEMLVQGMKDKYQMNWSKHDRDMKIAALVEEMVCHMEEWGLAERIDDKQICLLSGMGRWFGAYKFEGERGAGA